VTPAEAPRGCRRFLRRSPSPAVVIKTGRLPCPPPHPPSPSPQRGEGINMTPHSTCLSRSCRDSSQSRPAASPSRAAPGRVPLKLRLSPPALAASPAVFFRRASCSANQME
jgi:hypothetical protein